MSATALVVLAAIALLTGIVLINLTRRRSIVAVLAVATMSVIGAGPVDAATSCPPSTTSTTSTSISTSTSTSSTVPLPVVVPTSEVATTSPPPSTVATTAPTTTTTSPASTTSTSTSTSTSTTSTSTSSTSTTTIPLSREVTVSFRPTATAPFCSVIVTMAGFAPDTDYTVTVDNDSDVGPFPGSPWAYSVTTDGAGAAELTTVIYSEADPYHDVFRATVDGGSSAWVPISC
ncbi:hypothetical protein [Desertimonas flava]|uniref:hypothetical protein n=1 Tax=Desertimonas flava TaxID=2064846 RepID=UPI0013C48C28|nr:hypothetical protein [Desertimonas flava]